MASPNTDDSGTEPEEVERRTVHPEDLSEQGSHDQLQVNSPDDLTRRYVNPDRLVKSRLYESDTSSTSPSLDKNIAKWGVLVPVLAREEEGQLAVVDGWDRVEEARKAGESVPIWLPQDGQWSDRKALLARLMANTSTTQNQLNWLHRAWLLEDVWTQIGETKQVSPGKLAEELKIPQSTARCWKEPLRKTWTGTLLDRKFYENGQIRETHASDKYIKSGITLGKVVQQLGPRKLMDIRTRCELSEDIKKLLLKFVNEEITPDEFKQAKDLADEDGISLLLAVEEVQDDKVEQVELSLSGTTAYQVSETSSELGMDESELLEEATEAYLDRTHTETTQYDGEDAGHLRQLTYLDEHVDGPRPEPQLRMESNSQMTTLSNETVHLTVTSPPYNVAWDYGAGQTDNVQYYTEYLGKVIAETFRDVYYLTVEGGYCCIVVPWLYDVSNDEVETPEGTSIAADVVKVLTGEWTPTETDEFASLHQETNWQLAAIVHWYKGFHDAGLRNQEELEVNDKKILAPEMALNNFTEAILVLKKPGQRDVSQSRKRESGITWHNTPEDRDLRENVWRISPESWEPTVAEESDTAQFPEELAKRCILHWSYVGDTVLDPYAGRGTTLKMAKRLYRESIGYEIQEELEQDIREYVGMG